MKAISPMKRKALGEPNAFEGHKIGKWQSWHLNSNIPCSKAHDAVPSSSGVFEPNRVTEHTSLRVVSWV